MISLYKPYIPKDLPELPNILQSGTLAYGKWGRRFEQSLKDFIGCDENVLAVNSYTAALQVMLSAAGIKPGDEIIASPQCCLASTQPLATFGAKVVWADIDPIRGTLDPEDVERRITPHTKMIFHNHHCSYPGYIDEINAIGEKYGLQVVDDCIEAFGAEYKGRRLGNVGTDITTISFQTVRLPNTIDGGAIIFKDKTCYNNAVRMRDLGVDRTTFRDELGEINTKSDIPMHGYGVTMNEISSYIGYSEMLMLPTLLEQQRKNAAHWQQLISQKYPSLAFLDTKDILPSYWVFGILSPEKRKTIKRFREEGFYASGVHIPNTYYSVFGRQGTFKGVREFHSRFLALPSGWWTEIL